MTQLEEIEALLTGVDPGFIPVPKEMLLYALDCYRARVAVLEEYVQQLWRADHEPADASLWDLAPEQCLARQKGVG